MRTTHISRALSALLALAFLCLPLSACRESPILRETIYLQDTPEIDEEQTELDPDDEGEEDEQFEHLEQPEAETPRDSTPDEGFDQGDDDADSTAEVDYNPSAGNDYESDDAPSGGAQVTGEPESAPEPSGQETAAPSETETEIAPEPETVPGGDTVRQIVDGAGRTVDLPEDVETVTAVGWAAQMVEMLGGSGRLLAANQDFLSSDLAAAAFSDLASVQALWGGAGDAGISDENFAALLALAPDVCFEISGQNTFSEYQAAALTDAGIAYVVLPALSSKDTLTQAVTLAAEVLGGGAAEIADAYCTYVADAMDEVAGKTGGAGRTSLYLAAWDGAASYTLNYTKGVIDAAGSGLAVAYSPRCAQLVSTFLGAANVVNESTRIRSSHRDSDFVYVAPMFHQFEPAVSGSAAAFYSGAGEYGSAFDLFVARMVTDTTYYQLGSAQYPAVIAANESVRDALNDNWFWQYHETDANGYVTVSGERFYCGVVGPYDVYVNPQGMCDWAEGSMESPLEAYWAACKFSDAYTMDEVREETVRFYQQFFGLTLTDQQLTAIFGE